MKKIDLEVDVLKPGDKIAVQVTDFSLTSESISGGVEVSYPWSKNEKRICTVISDHPTFIRCQCESKPSVFGMSTPYKVSFDKRAIRNGEIIIHKI